MDRLRGLDQVAYVRFASIYRDFRDLLARADIDAVIRRFGTDRISFHAAVEAQAGEHSGDLFRAQACYRHWFAVIDQGRGVPRGEAAGSLVEETGTVDAAQLPGIDGSRVAWRIAGRRIQRDHFRDTVNQSNGERNLGRHVLANDSHAEHEDGIGGGAQSTGHEQGYVLVRPLQPGVAGPSHNTDEDTGQDCHERDDAQQHRDQPQQPPNIEKSLARQKTSRK